MPGKIQIAVSFESDRIKVVETVMHGDRLAVKKGTTYSISEFEQYLKQTKAEEFLVACDFPDMVHDVLYMPPAKEKFLKTLVEREVKKRFPEFKAPSVIYRVLREHVKDGRKSLEVIIYLVDKTVPRDIVDIFERSNKRVSFLYPSILPVVCLVHRSLESQDEVLLTVIDHGTTKNLLVSQNDNILFMRTIQSRNFGIDDIDADNINMTITYSRQTLRTEPAKIVILGAAEANVVEDIQKRVIVPVTQIGLPDSVFMETQVCGEGLFSAVALLLFASDLRWGNLAPSEHEALFVKRRILKYGAGLFLCFSLALSTYSVRELAEIPRLKAQMRGMRADMASRQSQWSEWIKARDELNHVMPLISFWNSVESAPDATAALQVLSFLPVAAVKTRSLRITNTAEGVRVEIKGEIAAEKYGEVSQIYQNFLMMLKDTGNLEIKTHSLEVKNRDFSIEGLLRQKGSPSNG